MSDVDLATIGDLIREYRAELRLLGFFSLGLLVASVVLFPIAVTLIPEDYFVPKKRDPARKSRPHALLLGLGVLIKNVLGIVLVAAGIAMLVLPGQGLLTILIGMMLTNFPGKYRLERRLVRQTAIINSINWVRRKAGKPPLRVPREPS